MDALTNTDLTQVTALLTIVGAIISLIWVVGQSDALRAKTGWRSFFIVHHVALIALGFAALWLGDVFIVYMSLLWAVTMFALVVWHYALMQRG